MAKKTSGSLGTGDVVLLVALAGIGWLTFRNWDKIVDFLTPGSNVGPDSSPDAETDPSTQSLYDWSQFGGNWEAVGLGPTYDPSSPASAAAQVEAAMAAGALLGLGGILVPLVVGLSPEVAEAVHAANVELTAGLYGLTGSDWFLSAEAKGNKHLFATPTASATGGAFMWNAKKNRCYNMGGSRVTCPVSSRVYGAHPAVLDAYRQLVGG